MEQPNDVSIIVRTTSSEVIIKLIMQFDKLLANQPQAFRCHLHDAIVAITGSSADYLSSPSSYISEKNLDLKSCIHFKKMLVAKQINISVPCILQDVKG